LFLIGTSSVSSAQTVPVPRCIDDALDATDGVGRNAWAEKCGYLAPGGADFFDAQELYAVFNVGCSHAGCSPVLPVTEADPCIPNLTRIGRCTNGFALTVSGVESDVHVSSRRGVDVCPASQTCRFDYARTAFFVVALASTTNLVDCMQFSAWDGICPGPGPSCPLELSEDSSLTALWTPISGCTPQP
jgi:hypothetical protein